MKTYFINLDRSPDRLDYMTRTLDGLGLDHERVAAVDGQALSEAELASHYRYAPGTQRLDRGSIACFLSHRAAWRRIAEQDDPLALILEDDIIFGENARAILSRTDWIPADADIIRLETFRRHTVYDRTPVAEIDGRDLVRLRHIHLGGGAYILTRAAAAALLARTEQFSYAVDYVLSDPHCPEFCGMNVVQMVPALCIQAALAPQNVRSVELPSILQATRKTVFSRGIRRFLAKTRRELSKERLILTGRLFDRVRGRRTGRIPFR
jgi:glycosyl transferase family 25